MNASQDSLYDLVIVGAGPVGLTLANIVGRAGLRALVVEQLDALIDYPRGVGMDDECLRAFQAIGVADEVTRHTTPHQWMEFRTARGRTLALIKPQTTVFGWPRRNAFIQPLVDRVLLDGVRRYPNVDVIFETEIKSLTQDATGVAIVLSSKGAAERSVRCRYIVGCDGGRSFVRKSAGIAFEGQTESTRWIVIDLEQDPIGVPNVILFCDPARPFVSIALPHAIRRLEFMVMSGETEESLASNAGLQKLLSRAMPDPQSARVIRSRVYTHHSRLASTFRSGRALIAGDAAHLMPVWQGQGYNSGIRDANNLGWKLVEVLKGRSDDRLLDSYTAERREHAAAMIRLSTIAGKIFAPTSRLLAAARDALFSAMKYIPSVRDYVLQMRFKPMPSYSEGVVAPSASSGHIVGRLFPQPSVKRSDGASVLLDDMIGDRFAIIAWAVNPEIYMRAEVKAYWRRLGGRTLIVRPPSEFSGARNLEAGAEIVWDTSLTLKDWFAINRTAMVLLRPDRFVAAAGGPQEASDMIEKLARLLCSIPESAQVDKVALPMAGG